MHRFVTALCPTAVRVTARATPRVQGNGGSDAMALTYQLGAEVRLSTLFEALLRDGEVAAAGIAEWDVQAPTLEDVFEAVVTKARDGVGGGA